VVILEFWPEHGGGPLWSRDGKPVDLSALPVPPDLTKRVAEWTERYNDERLPSAPNDEEWLAEGRTLLGELRQALGEKYDVIVTEPWWGEKPLEPPRRGSA
jgi:hypothetical protein